MSKLQGSGGYVKDQSSSANRLSTHSNGVVQNNYHITIRNSPYKQNTQSLTTQHGSEGRDQRAVAQALRQQNQLAAQTSPSTQNTPKPLYDESVKVGKVFDLPWALPFGFGACAQRFLVISNSRAGDNLWICAPILTYNGHGVGKHSEDQNFNHAIAYSGTEPPWPQKDELPEPGNHGMLREAIHIVPDAWIALDDMSRISFGAVVAFTPDFVAKAKHFGRVHPEHLERLVRMRNFTWMRAVGTGLLNGEQLVKDKDKVKDKDEDGDDEEEGSDAEDDAESEEEDD